MKEISVKDFREVMRPLSAGAGKSWSGEQVLAWYEIFQGFPVELIARGVSRLALTKRNAFVEPSDLIAILAEDQYGRIPQDAGEAYAEVRAALKVWYPSCPDSCARAAAMLSPWAAAALKGVGGFSEAFNSDNSDAFRAHFAKSYERVLRRAVETRVLPKGLRPPEAKALPGQNGHAIGHRQHAIEGKPVAALPAPEATTASQRFAEKVGRRVGDLEPMRFTQTEEEANAVKAEQARKLAEFQKRKGA